MSKSKGNVIDPLDLIDEYGADALRFTLAAMAAQGRDIKLVAAPASKATATSRPSSGTRRASPSTTTAGAVAGFDPATAEETLNRWIATETTRAAREVTAAIEAYQFNEAAAAVYRFVWNLTCDWYLELAKPVLNGDDGPAKDETRATVAWVLDRIVGAAPPVHAVHHRGAVGARRAGGRPRVLALSPWPRRSLRGRRGRRRDQLADRARSRRSARCARR